MLLHAASSMRLRHTAPMGLVGVRFGITKKKHCGQRFLIFIFEFSIAAAQTSTFAFLSWVCSLAILNLLYLLFS